MSDPIDCVLVGYKAEAIDRLLSLAAMGGSRGGGYSHILANSVVFRGKRMGYFDVLNTIIAEATGKPSNYHFGHTPSLAAHYLASYLHRRSFRTEIVNFFGQERDRFIELLGESPNAVAITTTFYVDSAPIKELVAFIRAHNKMAKIIVGGPRIFHILSGHGPAIVDQMLRDIGADIFVFDMQGEETLARICGALRNRTPLEQIPNIVIAGPQGFTRTAREPEANSLDENTVDWSLFSKSIRSKTVSVRTARGCAYKCSFCRYHILGGAHTLAGLAAVEKELDLLHGIGATHVLFIDDTFNIPLRRFKDICRLLIRKDYGFTWFSYFRCANADDEAIDLMAQAGCKGVFLGVESGDVSVLHQMNKKVDVERYRHGIRLLKQRGIITYATFITGFPGETEETINNTIRFIEETQPDYYSMEPYYHDPKAPIAAQAGAFELKGSGYSWRHKTMDWKQATEWSQRAYESIKTSSVLPLNDFDIWSIGYLLGEGMPYDKIKKWLAIMSEMLVAGLRAQPVDLSGHEKRLSQVFAS